MKKEKKKEEEEAKAAEEGRGSLRIREKQGGKGGGRAGVICYGRTHLAVHLGAALKVDKWKYHISSRAPEIEVAGRVQVAFLRDDGASKF